MKVNVMNIQHEIENYMYENITMFEELYSYNNIRIIQSIIGRIVHAYEHDKKVVWFGNGGSAADAQHLACELVGKFNIERKPLSSISLTTNTSILTAIGNDFGFRYIFSRQIEAMVNPGDVVIGITTSGNSENVIEGIIKAKECNAITICFTGANSVKNEASNNVDILLNVPSNKTSHIQEAHIIIGHIICKLVEEKLFGDNNE